MKKLTTVIAPSILSADFANLQRDCQQILDFGADSLHIDIMDGHFVPNLTIGPPVVQSLRKSFPEAHFDCHLMVQNPKLYLQPLKKAKINCFTFHYEAVAESELQKLCQQIKSNNIDVGLTIKPKTQPPKILDQLAQKKLINKFLIMTVQPGFGGQKFMQDMMPKVKYYRQKFPEIDIQVDGGINLQNIVTAVQNGANCFVAGSSIFGASDRKKTIKEMKNIADGLSKQ